MRGGYWLWGVLGPAGTVLYAAAVIGAVAFGLVLWRWASRRDGVGRYAGRSAGVALIVAALLALIVPFYVVTT